MTCKDVKLYELAGIHDGHLYSPFAFAVRFALAHKGIQYQSVPWRLVEKDRIAFTGQDKVRSRKAAALFHP